MRRDKGLAVVDDAPQVLPHAAIHWEAYNALTRCRMWLEGRAMPIPLSEIHAYARLMDWPPETIDDFLYVSDHLETIYFEWAKKESERLSRAQRRAGKSPRKTR